MQIANATYAYFGESVKIDGNLACVEDTFSMNLYHQDGNSKWVQFDSIDGGYQAPFQEISLVQVDIPPTMVITLRSTSTIKV